MPLEAESNYGSSVDIKRIKTPVHGFVTCRYCGKSVANPGLVLFESEDEQKKAFHYPFCKHKDKLYHDKSDDYFEQVFLSREFHTEAIKVLLPVQEIDSDATMAMFKAGLNLGLRYYFRGNPQHIAMRDYQEYNSATGKFDSYVVLYDTIPGGTGYLSKLFDTTEFSKVLRLAWEQLDSCQCQHEGKDGCYHCVLSYENKYTRGLISRSKAAELFKRIVDKSDNWETIQGSIGSVTKGGGIEESELETRFITSLREICDHKTGWSFSVESGIVTYYKVETLGVNGETRTYTIMPQVNLGPAKGVEFNTRPDFYLQCVKRQKGATLMPTEEIPDIALYLDGYAYHGTAQNGRARFYDDFKRREAIHRSGKIISWTMTWEDIDNKNSNKDDSLFIPGSERNATFWNHPANIWSKRINDYERFLTVLSDMDSSRFRTQNVLYLISWSNGKPYADSDDYLSFSHPATPATGTEPRPYVLCNAPKDTLWCETRVAVRPDNTIGYAVRLQEVSVDLDKGVWNHFWRLYNLLNLAKEDMFLPAGTADTDDVDSILENFDESVHDMVRLLLESGVEFDHDGGFPLLDYEGVTLCDAQLGSESIKVAIDPLDEASRQVYIQKGYTVLAPGETDKLRTIIGG